MKKILAIIAMLVSIVLLTFGLLFLIAAMLKPERILVAVALLASAALLLVWAIATLRREAEVSPEALATGIVTLARRLGGEVTVEQVEAEFRISAARALETLDKLRAAGQAQVEQREGRLVYILRGLQAAAVTRRCPYCGSNFPVREAIRQCPNCGASLEINKA